MRRCVLFLLALASPLLACASAPLTPKDFTWQQTITVSGGEAIYRFELPQAVYEGATRRDLGDLRVFNAAGEVVPHALLDHTPTPPAPLHWSPAATLRAGEKAGEFLFESAGLPVEALRLALPQANSVAPLQVFHRAGEREPWRLAANSVAYRLQRPASELVAPPIALCCSSDRHWRITFDQRGGGIGEGMPQVEVGWRPQQGVFVARGPAPFLLAYGSRDVKPAELNPATLIPGYRREAFPDLPEARLGPAARGERPPIAVSGLEEANWRAIGLWSVLVLGVLALAGMTWRLLSQMRGNG